MSGGGRDVATGSAMSMDHDSAPVLVAGVDDHPLVLRGLAAYFAEFEPDIRLTVVAATVPHLLASWDPGISVVLLDIQLADGSGPEENVERLLAAGAKVVVLTSEHRPAIVQRVLEAGALGLVLKEDPEEAITEAIRSAAAGRFFVSSRLAHGIVADPRGMVRLSERERDVLSLLARGLPWTTIARTLSTSTDTARTYCYRAIEKYAQAGATIRNGPKEVAYRAMVDGHLGTDDRQRR